MINPNVKKLAEILVNYSTKVKKGEYVQIIADYMAKDLALECYKLVLKNGAYPAVKIGLPGSSYSYYKLASDEQIKHFPEIAWHEIQKTQAVIYIGADENTRELSSVNPKKMSLRSKAVEKITRYRVEKTRWVIFDYPTNALAQEADMSLEEMEEFVYNACVQDWKAMKKYDKLANILNKGNIVRIKANDTDLTLSIKGRKAINSIGTHNMPDGEVFTAPVDNSANGHIKFTYPAIYGGREVSGVRLEFKNGKVIKASADKNEAFLKQMLNTDKRASYLGELGIGTNYKINIFIKNILFDEKIGGTIHLAVGSAYKECKGKNKSAIHWDMIKDLRKGGELWVDKKLIQKNGKFVI